MVSSYTTNKSIEKPASGDYVNTWATPVNADWDIIDKAFGGTTSLNVTAVSGTVALTATQYQALILNITGTLTANVTYQIPSTVGGQWIVKNGTTGAYTVTISSGGAGTSVVTQQGYSIVVVSDGTNITLATTSPVTAAGSNTQIQFNSSGVLGASANLTFNGTTFAITGAQTISTTLGVTGAITGSNTITGTALIPSGSSVPANGVYLPAANTVAVATNTTERLRFNSTGAWGLSGANYGTSGQVLTSAGSGAAPTWTTVSPTIDTQTFTSTGANTWTKPSSGTWALVEVWGAGGSGARNSTSTSAGGGAGGGYASMLVLLSALSATETATVGAGGASVTGSNAVGNAGGTSSFTIASSTGLSVSGGNGGSSSTAIGGAISAMGSAGKPQAVNTGGSGGSSSNQGSPATSWAPAGGGSAGSGGQAGGTAVWAGSGNGGAGGSGVSGTAGSAPGGGGGGSTTTSGAGADGQVRVTVF